MKFCDKVKKERRAKGLTQQQFADMLGVSLRTITNYEKGESYPKQREIYGKMAEILGVDINYLLTENEEFYIRANEKYGATGAQQAQALMQEVTGLFAGGELDQDDMHEIGHDRLHRDKADDSGGFAEYDIFDMCDRSMEYEANLFAAQFLISDEELYDCINCGYDIDKTAAALCTDRNLVALKVDILKKQGVKLRSQLHNNKFLAGD